MPPLAVFRLKTMPACSLHHVIELKGKFGHSYFSILYTLLCKSIKTIHSRYLLPAHGQHSTRSPRATSPPRPYNLRDAPHSRPAPPTRPPAPIPRPAKRSHY